MCLADLKSKVTLAVVDAFNKNKQKRGKVVDGKSIGEFYEAISRLVCQEQIEAINLLKPLLMTSLLLKLFDAIKSR